MGATKMHGIIKVFKQEYMWGVILGDDSVDYQFYGTNVTDPILLETLQNPETKSFHRIMVSFKPDTYRKKTGETKNIAVSVSAPNNLTSPSTIDNHNSFNSSSDNQVPSIPLETKTLVCQILSQEQENKGRTLWLAELVPLLKAHGVLINKYGYKKAKVFLHDLGFAEALPLGKNGAECIVLNEKLTEPILQATCENAALSLASDKNDSHASVPVSRDDTTDKANLESKRRGTDAENPKDSEEKELLSIEAQIAFIESRNVRFDEMDKDEAEYYLNRRANYFRLRAFRGGFQKFVRGVNYGKYKNLDFAWLVNLIEIDDSLRAIMRNLTSDLEQAARLIILEEVQAHENEPYGIVREFLQSDDGEKTRRSLNGKRDLLEKNELDPFVAGLVKRYGENNEYPIWAFLELITFGSLCWFYGFVSNRYESEEPYSKRILHQDRHIFQVVKILRNACAHGNCILNGLPNAGNASLGNRCTVNWDVKTFVKNIDGINEATIQRFLYDRRLYSIVTTLYAHQLYVEEDPYQRACEQLVHLADQMEAYRDCCDNGNNDAVFYAFSFLEKVIRTTHGKNKR